MITDLVLRVSGTVDFTDGTTNRFVAVWEDGALVEPFSSESIEAFKQLWGQRNVDVRALLQLLGGIFTITTSAPTSQKTVDDWTMLVDGNLTRDDGSSGNFNAVYDRKGGSRVTGTSAFAEVLASTSYKDVLDTVLEALAGSGKVAIAA